MKRYYKDRKELFDATREMEMEEDMEEGIQDKEEFGLMEEISGEEGNALVKLWRELGIQRNISNGDPWVIIGDFNVYLKVEEMSNESSVLTNEMNEFLECTQKLKKAFRFLYFVTDKKEFLLNVKESWKIEINRHMMYKVVKKMKLMKPMLNSLSWKNGNIYERVAKLKDCLKECQVEVDRYPHDENIKTKSCKVLNEYYEAMNDENSLLMQKEKVEWLKDSDRNTNDEAQRMCSRVSEVEIKNAIFDIEDSKALGPNGFTGRFYKSAWIIIGKDMYKAIQEFFVTGKILGEVNATLISLVPKLKIPNKVFDFRPIACFNVLYKCISKIVTNRIKRVLGKKKFKRVAFKIDIRKAYDTIDWSILKVILEHFGFRGKMVDWIMVCVSTTKFSININGERKDTSMEHYNGKKYWDIKSVSTIKEALEEFSSYSGLRANMNKITMFFGGMTIAEQNVILDIIPFANGRLPIRYLGVPLITKKINATDCKPLIDKDSICKPKDKGGLGIKNLQLWNEVLLVKMLWNIILKKNTLLVKWVNFENIKGKSIGEVSAKVNSSAGWKEILKFRDKIRKHVLWKIGDGTFVNAWYDNWNILELTVIENGNWPEGWENEYPILKSYKFPRLREGKKDEVFWVDDSRQERLIGERNNRIFKEERRDGMALVQIIKEVIRLKLAGFVVKESRTIRDVEERWNVLFQMKRNRIVI
nr:hypothetical protein [Tanacetum cinerariifolium]